MKMYAIVSSKWNNVFFTGEITETGIPDMINTPEKAKLFPTIEEAVKVRSGFKDIKDCSIREVEVRIIPGYIVKE